MALLETSKYQIEMILGREVSAEEHWNVESFADFSEQDKEDFRNLRSESFLMEIEYIKYRLKKANLRAVLSYQEDVIERGMDAEEWEKNYSK